MNCDEQSIPTDRDTPVSTRITHWREETTTSTRVARRRGGIAEANVTSMELVASKGIQYVKGRPNVHCPSSTALDDGKSTAIVIGTQNTLGRSSLQFLRFYPTEVVPRAKTSSF